MSEIINEKWISIEEAAEHLGIKPVTVRDWIKKEKVFPLIKSERNGNSNILNWMNGSQVEKVQWNRGHCV